MQNAFHIMAHELVHQWFGNLAATKNAKKDKDRPKKEKPPKPEEEDDDDDDDEEEEEEEKVEPDHVRLKRERGKRSFMKLVRGLLSFIPLALVLAKEPFIVRPRVSGTNAAKVRPLELALAAAIHWACESPTVLRQPALGGYMNTTARVLLTPAEFYAQQRSKRALDKDKTLMGAYAKADGRFRRLIDKEPQVLEMIRLPQPNFVAIGSYILTAGALLCPLISSYMEYLIVGGCIAIMHGGRALGMQPQPELYVTAAVAAIALFAMEAAGKASAPAKKKRR